MTARPAAQRMCIAVALMGCRPEASCKTQRTSHPCRCSESFPAKAASAASTCSSHQQQSLSLLHELFLPKRVWCTAVPTSVPAATPGGPGGSLGLMMSAKEYQAVRTPMQCAAACLSAAASWPGPEGIQPGDEVCQRQASPAWQPCAGARTRTAAAAAHPCVKMLGACRRWCQTPRACASQMSRAAQSLWLR